jgi:hypothetical protein
MVLRALEPHPESVDDVDSLNGIDVRSTAPGPLGLGSLTRCVQVWRYDENDFMVLSEATWGRISSQVDDKE